MSEETRRCVVNEVGVPRLSCTQERVYLGHVEALLDLINSEEITHYPFLAQRTMTIPLGGGSSRTIFPELIFGPAWGSLGQGALTEIRQTLQDLAHKFSDNEELACAALNVLHEGFTTMKYATIFHVLWTLGLLEAVLEGHAEQRAYVGYAIRRIVLDHYWDVSQERFVMWLTNMNFLDTIPESEAQKLAVKAVSRLAGAILFREQSKYAPLLQKSIVWHFHCSSPKYATLCATHAHPYFSTTILAAEPSPRHFTITKPDYSTQVHIVDWLGIVAWPFLKRFAQAHPGEEFRTIYLPANSLAAGEIMEALGAVGELLLARPTLSKRSVIKSPSDIQLLKDMDVGYDSANVLLPSPAAPSAAGQQWTFQIPGGTQSMTIYTLPGGKATALIMPTSRNE